MPSSFLRKERLEQFLCRFRRDPVDDLWHVVTLRVGKNPCLLRHAAGTHLLEGEGDGSGAHLRVVQEVLGHASLATTQRYTGVTTRAMQAELRRAHPRG